MADQNRRFAQLPRVAHDPHRAYTEYERAGRYWKASLGGRALRQIVPGDVERYKSKRIKEVAAATVNRESFALNTGFRRASQFRLPWSDVNFEPGIVTARGSKSGETYHVPMNEQLPGVLRGLGSRLKSPWGLP